MLGRLRINRKIAAVVTPLVLGAAAFLGYLWWDEANRVIATENAYVRGPLVQVSSPNSGRMFEFQAEIGSEVAAGQTLAVVDIPLMTQIPNGGQKARFLDAEERLAKVSAPVNGVIASRPVNLGDSVNPGQTLMTIIDTRNTWVEANIEETKIERIQVGQHVDIHVDAGRRDFTGRVIAIVPATTSPFSLLPTQNTSGNFTKV
ncbi:MAG: efflux RND transporter periplasmic adaptor subunit, partial [Chloroflexi bacterium]|nr:efflux RND transporter periplasmic adaptor subunit [Chloroflexota bacterium]